MEDTWCILAKLCYQYAEQVSRAGAGVAVCRCESPLCGLYFLSLFEAMLQTWLYASLIQTQISQQQLAQSFDFDNYFSSSATLSPFFLNILNKMSQQLLDGLA